MFMLVLPTDGGAISPGHGELFLCKRSLQRLVIFSKSTLANLAFATKAQRFSNVGFSPC